MSIFGIKLDLKSIFRNKMKTSKFFYTSAKRFQTTFGQNGLFEAEPDNFLSYCMSCPPRWPASGANSRDKVKTCFAKTEILRCVSIYPIEWWIGKSDSSLALLLICHQHLQLDSWGIRSLLLIYWRSADKRHLRLVFTICDTDFKGCHPLMWLCTSSKALSEECQCSGSCCLKMWCFSFENAVFTVWCVFAESQSCCFFCSSWHFVYHTPQGYLLFNQWKRCTGLTLKKAFIFFFNYIP